MLQFYSSMPATDYNGRFQTLLRESVKFSNFEKLFWSRDSAYKLTPMQ